MIAIFALPYVPVVDERPNRSFHGGDSAGKHRYRCCYGPGFHSGVANLPHRLPAQINFWTAIKRTPTMINRALAGIKPATTDEVSPNK